MPERRDEHGLLVARMDQHIADLARVLQPDMLPGLARVERAVDAVAVAEVPPDARLAHAHEDDIGIALCDRDGTDRPRPERTVRNIPPGHAAIGSLPDAAACTSEVEGHGLTDDARTCDASPAACRSDIPPCVGTEPTRDIHRLPEGTCADHHERNNNSQHMHGTAPVCVPCRGTVSDATERPVSGLTSSAHSLPDLGKPRVLQSWLLQCIPRNRSIDSLVPGNETALDIPTPLLDTKNLMHGIP